MSALSALAIVAALSVGQAEIIVRGEKPSTGDPDQFTIPGERGGVADMVRFENGRANMSGSMAGIGRRWVNGFRVERLLFADGPDDSSKTPRKLSVRSIVSDLEIGTVVPLGNVLVRLGDHHESNLTARIVRSMEYETLGKALGDGIILHNKGGMAVGERDLIKLDSMDRDAITGAPVFSGHIRHRHDLLAEADPANFVRVKEAKVGDVIKIADARFKVLSVVLPDKDLRIIGWVAFEFVVEKP